MSQLRPQLIRTLLLPLATSVSFQALANPTVPASPPAEEAKANEENAQTHEAAPVVITGTRRETALKDTPVAIEVITRKDLEAQQARSVADVLEMHQGISVTTTFRGAGIEVQGLSPKHVLVLIDGERVTGKSGEELDLTRISTESVERVEIVKGASSALYGSDALSGVINIITRKAKNRPEASLSLTYGDSGRAEIVAYGAGRIGKLGTALSFSMRRESDIDDPNTPGTQFDGHADISSSLRLDYRANDTFKIDARFQHLYRDQNGIDAITLSPGLDGQPRYRIIDRDDYHHALQMRIAPSFDWGDHQLTLSLSSSLAFMTKIEDQRNATYYDRRQVTRETLISPNLQWVGHLGDRNVVTAGLEFHYEHLKSERVESGHPTRHRFAAYAQDEIAVVRQDGVEGWDPGLVLVPGIRVDHDSQFGTAISPRLGLRFDPMDKLTLRASYGFGFRAPGFRELDITFTNATIGYTVQGNPDLEPEHSRSLEGSLDYRLNKYIEARLTAFRHDLDNLIVTIARPNTVGLDLYTYDNVAQAVSQGAELNVTMKPYTKLRLETGYSLTDSRDKETNLRISGRATHQIHAKVRWDLPLDFAFSGSLSLLAPRPYEFDIDYDGVMNRFDTDWQPMLDLRLARQFGKHMTFHAGLDNALDYTDMVTFPQRPRTFYVGLTGRY